MSGKLCGRRMHAEVRTCTFFAVVLVVVQNEATATLTAVASKGIDTVLLAASVLFRTLVLVWGTKGSCGIKC